MEESERIKDYKKGDHTLIFEEKTRQLTHEELIDTHINERKRYGKKLLIGAFILLIVFIAFEITFLLTINMGGYMADIESEREDLQLAVYDLHTHICQENNLGNMIEIAKDTTLKNYLLQCDRGNIRIDFTYRK